MEPAKTVTQVMGTMSEIIEWFKPVSIRQIRETYWFSNKDQERMKVEFKYREDGNNTYLGSYV
jgi:hypothetical protein